jgi:hypothetical protein
MSAQVGVLSQVFVHEHVGVPSHVAPAGSQVAVCAHVSEPRQVGKNEQVGCVPHVGNPAALHVVVPSHVGLAGIVGV